MPGPPGKIPIFDHKPKLKELHDKPIPEEFVKGKRFAFMSSFFAKDPPKLLGTKRKFARHGKNGTWVSECLPHFAQIVDDVTIVRSMATDVFNHAPAKLFVNTGSARFGRPSIGAGVTYATGSGPKDLRGFVLFRPSRPGPAAAGRC